MAAARTPPPVATPPPRARGYCDGEGRLVSADAPLAGLQQRYGGVIPGAIAIPMLAELVGLARDTRLPLTRAITLHDGGQIIRAWVEIVPEVEETHEAITITGLTISLASWQASARPAEDDRTTATRRATVDRALAELTAWLDAEQHLLAVSSEAPDLAELATAMAAGLGRPWTDFVSLPGLGLPSHHWRLLDGAEVAVAGSRRRWRASLIARHPPGGEPTGFELYLTSPAVPPSPAPTRRSRRGHERRARSVVGREIAPALRQPVARIIAHAETIRAQLAGPLAAEYSGYAGDIATAGQHLLALINELADLEVIEAEDFTTAADPIDLADVARRAAGILSLRARERGITLVTPPEAVHLPATAEFRRVLQVLLNLIGNAIHYAPEGSAVTLLAEHQGDRASITVADTGPGLSPDEQARVFDKFERLGRSGDGGSGLGLYISRRLARAMGGDLSVASEPGEGARFTLAVPG